MMRDILNSVQEFVRRAVAAARQQANHGREKRERRSFTLTNGQMIMPGIVTTYEWISKR